MSCKGKKKANWRNNSKKKHGSHKTISHELVIWRPVHLLILNWINLRPVLPSCNEIQVCKTNQLTGFCIVLLSELVSFRRWNLKIKWLSRSLTGEKKIQVLYWHWQYRILSSWKKPSWWFSEKSRLSYFAHILQISL